MEKLTLLTLSSLRPEKHGNITWTTLFDEDDLPWVDYFFVDVRNLLVQSVKVPEKIPLPELKWSWDLEFCIIYCYLYSFRLTSANTTMTGQQQTTSVNEVTPTTFKNTFRAPSFVWDSPEFKFEFSDGYETYTYKDVRLSINNLRLDTTFDYEYVPGLGIQISNLDIVFRLLSLRIVVRDIKESYGEVIIEFPPLITDWTVPLLSGWVANKREYEDSLEFRINCVLSQSQVDPERCEAGLVTEKYNKMNVVQLFETIVLGSLER
ncbi:hypothetical protein Ocin01_17942 [Orchesella cincta]|uniref:Uncharacterized protein n=1 Tax=Orchesella cincta TaxID=48709 RepID=A0A1D2M6Y2_ORCCI|nr:hypothetical protein Ocin01_17942 [Orchesella cincta]